MIWLVTEDSNSARDFWIKALDTFVGTTGYTVNTLNNNNGVITAGNKTLNGQINNVLKQVKENDILFVAFDNIEDKKEFVVSDFIRNTVHTCKKHNISFWCTKYYCFEEMYISYLEVERLYTLNKRCDLSILKSLQYTRNCIMQGVNYYDKQRDEVRHIISISSDANKNREHFANVLLGEVTRGLGYGFWFSKERKHISKSECWTVDCSKIQNNMNIYQKEKICDTQCNYCCKNKLAKDKFLDLEENSLMKLFNKRFEDLSIE